MNLYMRNWQTYNHKIIKKMQWEVIAQGRRNGFQSGGPMKHWKVLPATMVGQQEKFSNSKRSRMAKTIIFWPWWQPFGSFCSETFFFFFIFVSPPAIPVLAGPVAAAIVVGKLWPLREMIRKYILSGLHRKS